MSDEPVPGQLRHSFEGAAFFEQVGGTRHDDQFALVRQWPSARRLSARTSASAPPTIRSVGARTRAREAPARSGRPPRETTAKTRSGRAAAATSAAAAPVLAPNNPSGRAASEIL